VDSARSCRVLMAFGRKAVPNHTQAKRCAWPWTTTALTPIPSPQRQILSLRLRVRLPD